MRINSSRPCTVPSSPKRPCRALNAASGLASNNCWPGLSPGSSGKASKPSSRNALTTPRPDDSETSRSADRPPDRTAMRLKVTLLMGRSTAGGHPHALDFPFQGDAGLLLHPLAHFFAQSFQVCRAGIAGIDQEIGVLLADLRPANLQA